MHSIRTATPADIPLILDLIRALATYERAPDAVEATPADLLQATVSASIPAFWSA